MYCYKCGKEIRDDSQFCSFCGAEQFEEKSSSFDTAKKDQNANGGSYAGGWQNGAWNYYPHKQAAADDAPNTGFGVLSFFFPVVGLILFLVWQDSYPQRAKSCGKGAIIGVIVTAVLSVLFTVIAAAVMFTMYI